MLLSESVLDRIVKGELTRRPTVLFKRNVRRLKELGLTENLEIGYRLSPRGQRLLGE